MINSTGVIISPVQFEYSSPNQIPLFCELMLKRGYIVMGICYPPLIPIHPVTYPIMARYTSYLVEVRRYESPRGGVW